MKKWLTILLAFVFILSLAACGSDSGQPSSGSGGQQDSGGSGGSGGSGEFPKMELSLGHATANSETSHYQQGAEKFKELVEQATNGQVTIKIHPNAELGGEREMIEAVQLGTLDLVLTSSGPLGNFASLSNAFDFPFLFSSREHAYKSLDGEAGNLVNQQIESVGIKNLAWMENGFRNITNNVRPITKPDDLKGIKIRTMENKVHMAAFEDWGASPTPMSFAELFTALQQGVVDAQENPLGVIVPNKFYEVQKYMSLTGHFYSPAPLLMNKQKFDSFSPELQKIFLDAAAQARDYERDFLFKMDEQYVQTAKENGMEVVENKDVDIEAFRQAGQAVYDELGSEYSDIFEIIRSLE